MEEKIMAENPFINYLSPLSIIVERLEKLRSYVKECLWKLGYGRNQHLYALSNDIYFERRARKEYPYLFKIIEFYESCLDHWEKKYFVNEVLEKGEHYVFWHCDMSPKSYHGSERRALRKIKEGLLNEATPF